MDPYTGDEELDALVAERMATLVPEVMRVFDDPASSIYIESFAASAGLSGEQADSLKHEIMLMMLGFTQPDDFSFVLMTELEMPPRQAFAVEHWVKGVFLKEVMAFIEPQAEVALPQAAPATVVSQREEAVNIVIPEVIPEPIAQPEPVYAPEPAQEIPQEAPMVPQQVILSPVVVPTPVAAPVVAVSPVTSPVAAPIILESTPAPVPVAQAPEIAREIPVAPVIPAIMPTLVPAPLAVVVSPVVPQPSSPLQPITLPSVPKIAVPVQQQEAISAVYSPIPTAAPAPALPKIITPIPLPIKPVPAVPSITSGGIISAFTKEPSSPHTMFEDVARARGAITPAGVARYNQPLAQTPAYAK